MPNAEGKASAGGPIVRISGVSQYFGAVTALDDISMEIGRGDITGLVGDNGAGKSTLVKLISGVMQPSAGTIAFDGQLMDFRSPSHARDSGIETVYQDLALAENMAVWANVFLGRERCWGPSALHLLDKPRMIREAREMLAQFNMNIPPIEEDVAGLSGGQRQLISIARAAAWGSKLILMDEPTAALGVAETEAVERLIRVLRDKGFSILIISHNLDQVFRLADRVWVLRRGRMVGSREIARVHPNEIVAMITGAQPAGSGA